MAASVRIYQTDAVVLVNKVKIEVYQLDAIALVYEPVLPATVRSYQQDAVVLVQDALVPESFAPRRSISQRF